MKDIREKWEFILGFVAVIISLSAFKGELGAIEVDYHFVSFNLSEWLFVSTLCFIGVIYLYVIPYVLNYTKFGNLKIFKHLESVSYMLFLLLIASPILLALIYFTQLLLRCVDEKIKTILIVGISLILIVIICGAIIVYVLKYQAHKKQQQTNEAGETLVELYETAQKLFKEKFYRQSLIESCKVLEIGVYKTLFLKNFVFRRGPFPQMIKLAQKFNVFPEEKLTSINNVRIQAEDIIRQANAKVTEENAKSALAVAADLLNDAEEPSCENAISDSNYFIGKVVNDMDEAERSSRKEQKPMFIVIYDKTKPNLSKLDYSLGYFMEYETTKKMVKDNFIQVLISSDKSGLADLIPADDPLENCLLVILTPDRKSLRQEGVYANPDEGLKRVRESIAKWNAQK